MERFKVHDLQLQTINNYTDIAKGDLEKALCSKYRINRLDELNATDYDEVIDMIHTFIAKERQWKTKK